MIKLTSAQHYYDANTRVILPDLDIAKGDERVILGLSGSGKSTLLHVLAGLLRPTEGALQVNGCSMYSLNETERDKFRGKNIGIIFHQMHLIDSLTVAENLRLAQYMAGKEEKPDRILSLCDHLEISDKLNIYTDQLSHGQKQRVGIARAVINEPVVILADEPTSSLDDRRTEDVINLLRSQAKECEATLVISTHDNRVRQYFDHFTNLDELQPAGGIA